jgi:hypothetical protein
MITKYILVAMFAMLIAGLIVSGCASKPKVDWDARVGNYTYDQAVVELGPPDRESTLTDGRKVVEWVVGRSGGGGLSIGLGGYSGPVGVGVSKSVGPGPHDKILRLTFASDGKLQSWARN